MSWTAVNTVTWLKPATSLVEIKKFDTEQQKILQGTKDDSCGYQYRDEILNAAEQLIKSRPKRRRHSKSSTIKPRKVSKAKPSTESLRKKRQTPAIEDAAEEETWHVSKSPSRRDTGIELGCLENNAEDPEVHSAQPAKTLNHSQRLHRRRKETRLLDSDAALDTSHASDQIIQAAHDDQTAVQGPPATTKPLIIEISSDDDTTHSSHTVCDDSDYDGFDDSIFDEALGVHSIPERVQARGPPADSEPEPLINANGSPYPPFLHPCLLDSLDSAALTLNQRDISTPSLKHTCFRTAELLRLGMCLKKKPGFEDQTITVEMFATVHEVKYADHLGDGQGIMFSDLFFPNKPPYISAMSRIPYNAKDFTPAIQKPGNQRPVVKANLLLSPRSIPLPSRSGRPPQPGPKLTQQHSLQIDSLHLEVLDIKVTS